MNSPAKTTGTITLLDQSIDLRQNLRSLWQEQRPLIGLMLFTVLLDAASTTAFMSTVGINQELNPVIRYSAHAVGIFAGPLFGKCSQLLAVTGLAILAPRLARLLLTVVILMNLFAFVVNMHVFALAS